MTQTPQTPQTTLGIAYDQRIAAAPAKLKEQTHREILATPPPKGWLRQHPTAKGVQYLPIERVEMLLTEIYVRWWVEVMNVTTIANSVVTTIRLHVISRITGAEEWQDGIGAMPIHTAKGCPSGDFTNVLSDAVMKAAPASESYAVKDAAEKFGRIFGSDVNRKGRMTLTPADERMTMNELTGEK